MKPSREILWGFLLFLMTAIVIHFFIKGPEESKKQTSGSLQLSSENQETQKIRSQSVSKPTKSSDGETLNQKSDLPSFRQLPKLQLDSDLKSKASQQVFNLKFSEISSEWLGVQDLKTTLVKPANLSQLYAQVHQLYIVHNSSQQAAWPMVVYSQRQKDYGLITGTLILQIEPENLDLYLEKIGQPFYSSVETGFYYFKSSSFEELKKISEEARSLNPKQLQVEILRGQYARQ